jgi:SAM-dependent methyltransferase
MHVASSNRDGQGTHRRRHGGRRRWNKLDGDRFRTAAEALGHRPGNLLFQNDFFFEGLDFDDAAVLDIGAGDGASSFYAACAGARSIVSLEPEVAGSSSGMATRFKGVRDRIGADNVELRAETLQSFDPDGRSFDVLISIASINHLDEDACVALQEDEDARTTYLATLAKLADLANPGAVLVVADCGRRNAVGDLGIKNPIVPTIEWQKHQQPLFWAGLLGQVGFRDPIIRWSSLNSLRRPGRALLGNRLAAYLLTSGFCLTMERG